MRGSGPVEVAPLRDMPSLHSDLLSVGSANIIPEQLVAARNPSQYGLAGVRLPSNTSRSGMCFIGFICYSFNARVL